MNSKVFDEFVIARCEEILGKDEISCTTNTQINELQKQFENSLSNDQMKVFIEIESIFLKLKIHSNILIYKAGINDRINPV